MAAEVESIKDFFKHANPSTKLKLVGLGLLAIGSVFIALYSIYHIWQWETRWSHVNEAGEREVASTAPASEPAPNVIPPGSVQLRYELKHVSAPIASRSGRRTGTMQFTLLLEMPNKEAKHWMELNRAQLLSLIFDVANRFHYENFDDPKGIEAFKGELSVAYRTAFKAKAPSQIHIKDWVIQ